MKILHTSDWHIGRKLYNSEINQDLDLFFKYLISTINQEKIDVLIVAGDIFDLAYPSNNSLQQYYKLLRKLYNTNCKHIIITGGNHDSISTLNAPKNILEFLNIHVIGGVPEHIEEQIIKIKDETGKLQLIICAIPYLRDKNIRKSIAGEKYDARVMAIREGIANFYHSVAEKAMAIKTEDENTASYVPIIATAHLFVNNVDLPKEEKELYVGSLQQISSKRFPEIFDYIALGHIHRPQKIDENIRYSGSPVAMSFSERNQTKSIVILEKKENSFDIKTLEIPKFRNLKLFKGTFQEVQEKISSYKDDGELPIWAEIEIIEQKSDPELKRKAINYIDDLKMLVLNYKIIFEENNINIDETYFQATSLKDINNKEIFAKLLNERNAKNQEELMQTYNELINDMPFSYLN